MLASRHPQLNKHGELIHLLTLEGLPRDVIHHILDTASTFLSVHERCSSRTARARARRSRLPPSACRPT
jgi:hypothetical protein